jgi:DNA-binding transcriptional LysR family regulator
MNITFRQLNAFQRVAKLKSYTKASKELHLTQPAVSSQIKKLEEQVGLPLLEIIGKNIFVTDAGKDILECSEQISNVLENTITKIDALKGKTRGKVKLSVATTASYFVINMLSEFTKNHPEISISLDVTNRSNLLKQLDHNETDLVVMGEPPSNPNLESVAFKKNPLVMVANKHHPLVNKKNIAVKKLAKESFVSREQGSGTRAAIERKFNELGVPFTASMETSSNGAIKQAVISGLGLGIASLHTLDLEIESKKLFILDVDEFPIIRYWYMVQKKGKTLSPVTKAFQDYILNN